MIYPLIFAICFRFQKILGLFSKFRMLIATGLKANSVSIRARQSGAALEQGPVLLVVAALAKTDSRLAEGFGPGNSQKSCANDRSSEVPEQGGASRRAGLKGGSLAALRMHQGGNLESGWKAFKRLGWLSDCNLDGNDVSR